MTVAAVGRIGAALAAFGAVSALASAAAAATLRFSVPNDCDPRVDVIEDVERLIGRSLDEVDAEFDVVITAAKQGGYELSITSPRAGEVAERRLTGETCAEIGNAAAVTLAIAMRLDAEPETERDAKPVVEAPAPAPAPSAEPQRPERDVAPRPVRTDDPNASPFAVLGLSAVADTGVLPAVAAGGELSAGVGFRGVRFMAFGTVLAPASASLSEGRGGEFRLIAGTPAVCFERARSVALRGCLGFELGRLSGEGTGVASPRLGSALWAAPRGELGVVFPLADGFAGVAGLGALMPLSRRPFVLDDGEEVHRPAAFSLRGRLGVEFRP